MKAGIGAAGFERAFLKSRKWRDTTFGRVLQRGCAEERGNAVAAGRKGLERRQPTDARNPTSGGRTLPRRRGEGGGCVEGGRTDYRREGERR